MTHYTPDQPRRMEIYDEGEHLTVEEVEALRDQVLQGVRSLTVETSDGQVTGNVRAILVRSRLAIIQLEDGSMQEIELIKTSTRH